ncbi:SAM-dependent methyltransferase [Coprococcus catus]|uniref:N-6 DNA methylase n=1 Tax=Coprococcus catus TaxID=116085 RepID=UPI001D088887|nr:N-6 DNA methylase [Coprococcus catus]MCB6492477.1 SAM-dependent methyltransferase [Coprococcus catus]
MGNIDTSVAGVEKCSAVDEALSLFYLYIQDTYSSKEVELICNELKAIARREDFMCNKFDSTKSTYTQVQDALSKINEKQSIRKSKGVYYTPNDVVRFILTNSIKASFGKLTVSNISDMSLDNIPYRSFCCNKTVFDPTCGAGEYLLTALEMKINLLKNKTNITKNLVRKAVSTIYGNDVNVESIIITELRLLLLIIETCGVAYCTGLGNIMNRRFTSFDFIADEATFEDKYHIVVGNPPYVEDFKSGLELSDRYGNIYANILLNAAKKLEKNGAIGFIIPLSYVSTPRMKKLRDELGLLISEQYILSFADRPDCLFDSVHQKLCILIGKDKKSEKTVYTGNYQYWYKQERATLFTDIQMVKNKHKNEDFIPKLGTEQDIVIYKKITDTRKMQSVYDISRNGTESVYLNRREAFWMKAYREQVDDPEYKVFSFKSPIEADYCYCLINSSLFWWYWISVSDCWHVSKDLNGFMMPMKVNMTGATELAQGLRQRLEETKVYVGTKQTQYEYKHRECLEEIRAIDDFINAAYGLTEAESNYIKNFAIRYRTSGGIDADENN